MRNKKLQVWLPLILSLCMVAGMFIGYRIKGNMPNTGIFFTEQAKTGTGSNGFNKKRIC